MKAPHSKCGIRATVSGVRIPSSPPSSFSERKAYRTHQKLRSLCARCIFVRKSPKVWFDLAHGSDTACHASAGAVKKLTDSRSAVRFAIELSVRKAYRTHQKLRSLCARCIFVRKSPKAWFGLISRQFAPLMAPIGASHKLGRLFALRTRWVRS